MDDLLSLLESQQIVLVPGPMAGTQLRDAFRLRQQAAGRQAWAPPQVFTWSQWTGSLWSSLLLHGTEDRVLLNQLQEESLWAGIIATTSPGLSPGSGQLLHLAQLAKSALQMLASHLAAQDIGRTLQTTARSTDARAFAGWFRAFISRCERDRFLPPALLEDALTLALQAQPKTAPFSLHLYGFAELTPTQDRLLQTLQANGARVQHHAPTPHLAYPPHYRQAGTPEEELRWALTWVRRQFEADPPQARTVALILPEVAAERATLDPLLREVLAPELESIAEDLSSTPWRYAQGVSLATLPLVRHALLLLRWVHAPLPIDEISTLLLSPFLEGEGTLEARARFDSFLLRKAEVVRPELEMHEVLTLAHTASSRTGQPPIPLQALAALWNELREKETLSGKASFSTWAERIRKLLRRTGWPGPRTLNPAEYRAHERWDSVLDLLATLDAVDSWTDYRGFLQALTRECQRATVPGAGGSGAPVQITTLREIEGCSFDCAVVLRSTDLLLPTVRPAHPLLSRTLQRRLALPEGNTARSHQLALRAVEGLRSRCGSLLFTAPEADENGPIRLSPLVDETHAIPLPPQDASPVAEAAEAVHLTELAEDPALPPLASLRVPGGASVLEAQAACGFRAFASFRLAAKSPQARTLGLDARSFGDILHRATEHLWTELKSQQQLRALTEEARQQVLERAVAYAFSGLTTAHEQDSWTLAYNDVLRRRLTALLRRWLRFELDRGPFTVLPPEQKRTVQVGPLELSVRLDRVDCVDGGQVVVDYKTSAMLSTEQWLGERPELPQLPLYATLTRDNDLRGLAFAWLRAGRDMKWISLQDQPGIFPGRQGNKVKDLAAQLESWRAELGRLAEAFAHGDVSVDPRDHPHTCKYCQHRLLCRLDPSVLIADEEVDLEDLDPETLDG